MIDSFAFSEVVRKLASLIRLGKIAEVKDNLVRVEIGPVKTNWLPIVSQAGATSVWTPISVGEQVAVFSPYGESAQGFVLRSINYDSFKTPENAEDIVIRTDASIDIASKKDARVNLDGGLQVTTQKAGFDLSYIGSLDLYGDNSAIINFDNGIEIHSGNASITLKNGAITLKSGNAEMSLSNSGIQLSCGSSSINIGSSSISLDSGAITASPPLCKCNGGF
ncbi:MAG: phage baseplate assembly protein V [Alphaproteobacteria bacterium]|nr:phage baseplate assembly protein V [Alphaproteobacteria bacterium]